MDDDNAAMRFGQDDESDVDLFAEFIAEQDFVLNAIVAHVEGQKRPDLVQLLELYHRVSTEKAAHLGLIQERF